MYTCSNPDCRRLFVPQRKSQRFCRTACREAKLGREKRERRGTAVYGSDHQKLRKQWDEVVQRGEASCWRCGRWLPPGLPWHLGHDDYDRSVYRGPECPPCNLRAAAVKGNRMRARFTSSAPRIAR